MERREQYKRIIMFLASAFILIAQTGVFAYVWFHFYAHSGVIRITFWYRGNYVVVGQYALMLFFFYKIYGGFKVGYLRVFDVLYSQILSVLFVNGITYLQLCLIGRWKFTENLKPIIKMTGVDLCIVIVWVIFMRWIYTKIYPPRQMLLVYGEYSPDSLISKIAARKDKYNICETVSISIEIEEIKKKIEAYHSVILADIPSKKRNLLLKYCFEKNIRCYSVPKLSDIMIMSAESIHLFDTSLLLFRNGGLTAEQKILKRAFDLIGSLLFIIIASPIMLIIAFMIKAYDKGPILYKQKRLTQNGREFNVLKFRSMRVNSENQGTQLTRKNDERVTPVGKVLRNIHFDEIPQVFNILKGDMSFVGPRPECPHIAEKYAEIIPEFGYRLKVKAGLTGFAQVYGKYNTTPYDKLKLDLTYIENYTFWLDIKLMLLTFKILFQKENTEGVEPWQMTAATKENLKKIGQDTPDK
ncbi:MULTISPECIES: exopolysaccharide biosynthesis polyprenyl glycosylphosphotransferase [Blautia]|uniref:exopolysaccharide biosynthesis polyprenyl glycosylphosphotransferase n=1 Tax=Blautia TaxID=572511 RepID=UPI000BA477E0|nr:MULTISPECIES: exopolysaccharide biosynthesis polyprenyl glycosylphosphotransferase [Blautia]